MRRVGGQGSLQHAMAVIEDREQEMSHLFDQLHDIQSDLSQMTDQVRCNFIVIRLKVSVSDFCLVF